MYNMDQFISVFHMKFVRIVQHLWILSVSQPKLTFKQLVKKSENKVFFILFVFSCILGQPNNNSMGYSYPLSVDYFLKKSNLACNRKV